MDYTARLGKEIRLRMTSVPFVSLDSRYYTVRQACYASRIPNRIKRPSVYRQRLVSLRWRKGASRSWMSRVLQELWKERGHSLCDCATWAGESLRLGSVWTAAASEQSYHGPRCPTQLCLRLLCAAQDVWLSRLWKSRLCNDMASKFVPCRVIPLKAQCSTPPRVLGDSWFRFCFDPRQLLYLFRLAHAFGKRAFYVRFYKWISALKAVPS